MAFTWTQRVYIEDTDFGGIVYYVNYLKFMERARTELLRSAGVSQQQLRDDNFVFVVRKTECTYLQPARLDDELLVDVSIETSTPVQLTFLQRIFRKTDSVKLCEARVQIVCVSADELKPRRLPAGLLAAIEGQSSA
ncbi:tol-pal system-associated acyl-CoA thioesterase [Nitrincola tapanii]|jgi:tol-pal system-associated acyl-CoA thioesterase|uniref:Tol-pal system-associated acyl-CoA thioesterase n=1 Tax=Nitrincola tapanii TaxID=1708751 RepID=A0A5A9W4P0_9GAMM|nr:tol-pal system-associated acyl-CoA thioesterase [Nitrincola tapanii]KAA0875115.1 tol-pal system-associated acyl-CoA thioesterase [Nitrincola tapanii]